MPRELDAYIEKARRDSGTPGLAVSIVKDGRLLAAKGYGVRELGKEAAVDENTLFDVASLTKSFTAAAIATLVDQKKMRWDDPVRRHLPGFELADPDRTQHVTIRDLLAHRLGLEQGNFMFRFTGYDTAEVIRRMRYLEEREPFRSVMIYSNVGYTAAGEAAAAAAGMSYSDLVRTRLIEPLGMRATTVGVEHTLAANHASPHAIIDGVHRPIRNKKAMNILPADGVNSNALDMARWLLFQLGDGTVDGKADGKRIISSAAMAEMHSPQMLIATTASMRKARNVRTFAAYGLGWNLMDFGGHPMHWHSGGADGMPVYMAILPDDGIGVAVLTNTWASPTLHLAIASRVLDTLLGTKEMRDWVAEALGAQNQSELRPEEARIADTTPSRPLEAYAGSYESPLYGSMVVRVEGGKASLQFGGGEVADLQHWHYDTFRAVWRDRAYEFFDTLVTFTLDVKGAPRRMEMALGRDTIVASRAAAP
jgi:CubicO group peptidase (beta-lactamase class C family)